MLSALSSLFSQLSSQRALRSLRFFLFSLHFPFLVFIFSLSLFFFFFLHTCMQRLVLPKFKQAVRMYEDTVGMQLVVDSHSKPVTFWEKLMQLLQHYYEIPLLNQTSYRFLHSITLILIQVFDTWHDIYHAYLSLSRHWGFNISWLTRSCVQEISP